MMTAKDPDHAPQMVSTSTSPSIQANRLSWYFDLRGPSIHVNTACSSSMITMDLACQSLRSGQSSMVCGAEGVGGRGVQQRRETLTSGFPRP